MIGVECCVFIVDIDNSGVQDGNVIYPINSNRNDVETYPKFQLWIYPNDNYFKRLEIDTLETLKFRKQNYYMDTNRKKCEKINWQFISIRERMVDKQKP